MITLVEELTIKKGSSLFEFRFNEDSRKVLYLYSNYVININGAGVEYYDLIEESLNYFLNNIIDQRVAYVKYNRRGKLWIKIESDPILEIILDPDTVDNFGEYWQFNDKSKTIIF